MFAPAVSLNSTQLSLIADWLVVAIAVSLPWSTSATSILLVLWLIVLLPTLSWSDIKQNLLTLGGGLPVLLFLLGVLGMMWANVPLSERLGGLDGFAKLLVVPLLSTQFHRSGNGYRVFVGFLLACLLLLAASLVLTIWPNLPKGSINPGVAVKNYIVQSVEFVICSVVLLYLGVEKLRAGRFPAAASLLLLSAAFLTDVFYIATGRTALVILAALVPLYGFRQFRWRGLLASIVLGAIVAGVVWTTSSYLRARVFEISRGVQNYENQENTNVVTSSEERLVFWKKSLQFVADRPLLGHGTGSIDELFRESTMGRTGVAAEASSNPHNQTFAVGIQLGLIGIVVLWAMWIAQMSIFFKSGFLNWIGLVIVVQNAVGSLFNSFIFDFTEGWLYVIGLGILLGLVGRSTELAPAYGQRSAQASRGMTLCSKRPWFQISLAFAVPREELHEN